MNNKADLTLKNLIYLILFVVILIMLVWLVKSKLGSIFSF